MIKKFVVAISIVGLVSCALGTSLVHDAVLSADKVTTDLEKISSNADLAVKNGYLTPNARQQFAQVIMLPAIAEVQKLVTFLKTYDPTQPIPPGFAQLNRLILAGVNNIFASIPSGPGKDELINLSNIALADVNLWLSKTEKK
jgi:hypothetical protein